MRKNTIENFVEYAKKVHGDKYDYSKVEYVNNSTKVCIICPIHGEFWQTPHNHTSGAGCPKCAKKYRYTTEEWIDAAKKVHGDKYDYSKVAYKSAFKKICIICPIHGEFWQTPSGHISGGGCLECYLDKRRKTTKQFIEEAKKVHGDKYNYSKVEYINTRTKVCIICSKHGEFWQTPHSHLTNKGCPFCNESNLEKEIGRFLHLNEIKYKRNFNDKWLGKQHLDFYLPKQNIAIECQGIQHFEPKSFGSHEDISLRFQKNQQRDKTKIQKCKENGIKLYHYVPFQKYFGTYENEIHNVEELKKLLFI